MFKNRKDYCPDSLTDKWCPENKQWIQGDWRTLSTPLDPIELFDDGHGRHHRPRNNAWNVRESLAQFFRREGSVPWQEGTVTYTGRDEFT